MDNLTVECKCAAGCPAKLTLSVTRKGVGISFGFEGMTVSAQDAVAMRDWLGAYLEKISENRTT